MVMVSTISNKELLEFALNCVFPTSEEIDPLILKEITHFLETNAQQIHPEDAEIVRGEVRKAMIHFKNRPYLWNMRKKVSEILNRGNLNQVYVSSYSFTDELRKVGLSKEEINVLKFSIKKALYSYNQIQTIPSPK